jgi:hypothetical protein
MWVINTRPGPLYLPKETLCPLYRRLGGRQGHLVHVMDFTLGLEMFKKQLE